VNGSPHSSETVRLISHSFLGIFDVGRVGNREAVKLQSPGSRSAPWVGKPQQIPALRRSATEPLETRFIRSISPTHVEALMRCIANQEEHHRRETFPDEFRRLCKLYGLEIDEWHSFGVRQFSRLLTQGALRDPGLWSLTASRLPTRPTSQLSRKQ
jgi:hypothetical protein